MKKKMCVLQATVSIITHNHTVGKMFDIYKRSGYYWMVGIEMIKTGKLTSNEKMKVLKLCARHWEIAKEVIKSDERWFDTNLLNIFDLVNYHPAVVLTGLNKHKKFPGRVLLKILKICGNDFLIREKIIKQLKKII